MYYIPNDICQHWDAINNNPFPEGPIAVFGVYNGKGVPEFVSRYNRDVWAFDTFEGMPAADYIHNLDSQNPPGKFKPDHDVHTWLHTQERVKPFKGRFVDTLVNIPKGLKFGLIYLDCDYYNSYKQVLEYLESNGNLQKGTLIIFDDYRYLAGAKKAVDEWLVNNRLIIYNQEYTIYE